MGITQLDWPCLRIEPPSWFCIENLPKCIIRFQTRIDNGVQSFCHTLADIIACVAGTLFFEGFDFERVKWLGVRKKGSCKEKNTVKKKGGPALTLSKPQKNEVQTQGHTLGGCGV